MLSNKYVSTWFPKHLWFALTILLGSRLSILTHLSGAWLCLPESHFPYSLQITMFHMFGSCSLASSGPLVTKFTWATKLRINHFFFQINSPCCSQVYSSSRFSPWFTWLNEPTTNRRFPPPPMPLISKNPISHLETPCLGSQIILPSLRLCQ
jgi:hypothetical protein